jgi:hypothetical protein
MLDPIEVLLSLRKEFNPMRGGKNAEAHRIIQHAIYYLRDDPYYSNLAKDILEVKGEYE